MLNLIIYTFHINKNVSRFLEGKMKLWFVVLHIILVGCSVWASNYEDNEFAEFEDFDTDEEIVAQPKDYKESSHEKQESNNQFVPDDDIDDIIIEDDTEFEHFQDTEEFEGFAESKDEKLDAEPKITITKVPIHFRANWDSYWLEILMVAGLVVYFINFATGKSKNSKLANTWFQTHRTLLEEQFSLVGNVLFLFVFAGVNIVCFQVMMEF